MFINLLKYDLIKGIRKFYLQICLSWIGMIIASFYFMNLHEKYQGGVYHSEYVNNSGILGKTFIVWIIMMLIMVTAISILLYTDDSFSTKTSYQTFLTPIYTKKNILSKIIVYFILNFILILGFAPIFLRGYSYIDVIFKEVGIFGINTVLTYIFATLASMLFVVTLFIFVESILRSKFVNKDFGKNNKTLIKFVTIIVTTNIIGRIAGKLVDKGDEIIEYTYGQDRPLTIIREFLFVNGIIQLVLAIIFFFVGAKLFDKYKRVS